MRVTCGLFASLLALACGSAPSDEDPEEPEASGGSGGASCAGRGQPLVPELVLSAAEDVDVKLLSLEPPIPVVGDNAWQVQVTRTDVPLEGASLSVLPWMPDHEHASTKTVYVSELEPGAYRLAPVFLGMVGYWEVGIEIAVSGEVLGSVSLNTCLSRE
jgi:hypothetical protein